MLDRSNGSSLIPECLDVIFGEEQSLKRQDNEPKNW